jgi:hypothetical protein
VSQQRLNPFTAGAQVSQRLDQVETRQLQAPDYRGVERRGRHDAMVPAATVESELQTLEVAGFPSLQTLESVTAKALILEGMRTAGMNHGQVCAYIGNRKGGPYDQSQWTKALDTGDVPLGRMLAGLPLDFWRPVIARMAQAAGVPLSDEAIANITMDRIRLGFQMLADAFARPQQQRAG